MKQQFTGRPLPRHIILTLGWPVFDLTPNAASLAEKYQISILMSLDWFTLLHQCSWGNDCFYPIIILTGELRALVYITITSDNVGVLQLSNTHYLPCITFKSAVWCDHINTRRFEWKFSWEYQLAMVYTTWKYTIFYI